MKSAIRAIGLVAALVITGAGAPAQSQPARPAPPALGDGPWDLRTETGLIQAIPAGGSNR